MKRSIIITGSTDGIGKLAAIKFAKDGHEIYLHGRNAEKLSKVIAELKELSDNKHINGFVADFSDMAAVKAMAKQICQEVPKIDVLINNAGVFKSPISDTKGGFDIRFVVNYFAPFVLTKDLLPLLQKGTVPRIINVSSAAQAAVSYEALSGKIPIAVQAAYAQSKLALTMWSFNLARTTEDITVIAVNPGSLLDTNMVKEGFGYHWSSADKGANILYDLAIEAEHKSMSGKYYDNDKGAYGAAHANAYDDNEIKKLICETNRIIAD